MSEADARWMTAALALARRGIGCTAENPSVGCLLIRGGRVIGRGRTADGGRPHAETLALADTAARYGPRAAQGATAYVTLEPCAHHGRTPPCTQALIAAGIARVVVPFEDPDVRVGGRGLEQLRAAGISVTVGPGAEAAGALLQGYLLRRLAGRPSLTLKLASSLDGRIATRQGESRWITGPQARRAVHLMRAQHDCVLVGSGTLIADDARLDVRLPGMPHRPLRAILDRRLRTPPESRLFEVSGETAILGDATAFPDRAEALRRAGAEVIDIAGNAGVDAGLAALAERGVSFVFCEGGATLAAALMAADRVDRLIWFGAGLALGADATAAIGQLEIDRLEAAPRFALDETRRLGDDVMSIWSRRAEE